MSQPFKFHTRIRVRFNETDLQGHVNFGQYYFYFDEATTHYFEAIGQDEVGDLGVAGGRGNGRGDGGDS